MAQKEYFQVIYDGTGLKSNEMDVRDLAPALLAISDVLDESNKIIYGDRTKVQVNVKGSFKTGSFAVELSIAQLPIDQLVSLFDSDGANAASNLLQMVGFVVPGGGLIGLLLWLKNRKIKKIENVDDAKAIIEVENEEKYETSPKVIALFSNVKVRTSIQKIVTEPLSREGIDTLTVKKGNEKTTIKKEEKDYFKLSEIPDELLKDQIREVFLKVLSISFVEGHKWKFSDGNVEFFATITDEEFVKKVQESKDGFYKDDLFKVSLREKQWIADTGIKSDYEIEKVIDHRSGAKQIKLPFEDNEKNTKQKG